MATTFNPLSILSGLPLWVKAVAILAVVAAVSFALYRLHHAVWQSGYESGHAAAASAARTVADATAAAQTKERDEYDRRIKELNQKLASVTADASAQHVRQMAELDRYRTASRNADLALDGVRSQLAALQRRLAAANVTAPADADATPAATTLAECNRLAAVATGNYLECRDEYRQMGLVAATLRADVDNLRAAWPTTTTVGIACAIRPTAAVNTTVDTAVNTNSIEDKP